MRREVGAHAKVLNKITVHQSSFDPNGKSCSQPTKSYSNSESSFEPQVLNIEANTTQSSNKRVTNKLVLDSRNSDVRSDVERVESEEFTKRLKESVGHNEVEVMAGALLGFLVSLAVYTIT